MWQLDAKSAIVISVQLTKFVTLLRVVASVHPESLDIVATSAISIIMDWAPTAVPVSTSLHHKSNRLIYICYLVASKITNLGRYIEIII